jgi:DUF1680 family protein
VYCFEQADQAARLEELALDMGTGDLGAGGPAIPLAEREVVRPAIGRTIQVIVPAAHAPLDVAGASSAINQDHAGNQAHDLAVSAVAIPYFQWDNRGPGPMRVWMPVAGQVPPTPR